MAIDLGLKGLYLATALGGSPMQEPPQAVVLPSAPAGAELVLAQYAEPVPRTYNAQGRDVTPRSCRNLERELARPVREFDDHAARDILGGAIRGGRSGESQIARGVGNIIDSQRQAGDRESTLGNLRAQCNSDTAALRQALTPRW